MYSLNSSAFLSLLFSQIKALIQSLRIPNLAKGQYFPLAILVLLLLWPCSCTLRYCCYGRFSYQCASHPFFLPLDCSFCFAVADPVLCLYRVYCQLAVQWPPLIKDTPVFPSLCPYLSLSLPLLPQK